MKKQLPSIFCWTRMGVEAGQSLELILLRKELERVANDGLFIWGIGNSLGDNLWKFLTEEKSPKVLFSEIKSKPKTIDVMPELIYFWTYYVDRYGCCKELPKNSLVLSRANTMNDIKKKHYALVCHKKESIKKEEWETIDFMSLKNFDSTNDKIGYSQVTAIVERNGNSSKGRQTYPVIFSADLVEPYFITLMNPVIIAPEKFRELSMIFKSESLSASDWTYWLADLYKPICSFLYHVH